MSDPADRPNPNLPPQQRHDLVFLPLREHGEMGIYPSEIMTLVKELKGAGVDAAFFQDAAHREWLDHKSADVVVSVTLVIVSGVVSAATWDGIKAVFGRYFPRQNLTVRFGIRRTDEQGTTLEEEWFEATGSGADVVDAMRARSDADADEG